MNCITDFTNIEIPFSSLTTSTDELNSICQKCLAYLDMPKEAIENAEELFLLSKVDFRYIVLYYHWLYDYKPIFFEIDGNSIKKWDDVQAVEFVLKFALNHPNERLTSFDYRKKQSFIARNTLYFFYEIANGLIAQSLPEKERDVSYREYMQAIMYCLYNYDFMANIKRGNFYYEAQPLPICTKAEPDEAGLAHYER